MFLPETLSVRGGRNSVCSMQHKPISPDFALFFGVCAGEQNRKTVAIILPFLIYEALEDAIRPGLLHDF